MPTLTNAKYERFAQALATSKTVDAAYAEAGFTPNRQNACRLAKNPKIVARLAEIMGAAAERVIVTIHDIAIQLDEDRLFAREMEAPAAAISATMGKAKVLGLLTEKVEHTGKDGGPIEVSDWELARLIAFQLTKAAKGN